MKHTTPEQMFDAESQGKEAVSTVKALQVAASEGQKTYQISKKNMKKILPKLKHDSEMMSEITNALNAGKEVTTHEKPVEISGWNGSGYVILNPEDNSGAWKISGGTNGGFLALVSNLTTLLVTLYEGLDAFAKHMKQEVKQLGGIAKRLGVMGFLLDAISLIENCGLTGSAVIAIFATLLTGVLVALIAAAMSFITGPIGGFFATAILSQAFSQLLKPVQGLICDE